MPTLIMRKILKIDQDLCTGCGNCVLDCAENAIEIRGGKAYVIKDSMCDGLGACIGNCPTGALTIIERMAEPFEEPEHLKPQQHQHAHAHGGGCPSTRVHTATQFHIPAGGGCPSARMRSAQTLDAGITGAKGPGHWPLKLVLIPADAPFLKNADLVVAADCAAFHDPSFHAKYANGVPLMIACPKMMNYQELLEKLTAIFTHSGIKSCRVARMEVPCCSALLTAVKEASARTGNKIPLYEDVLQIFS